MTETLTLEEVAALRRCSIDTVRRAIRRGELPTVRLGRTLRIPYEAMDSHAPTDMREIVADAFRDIGEQLDRLEKAVSALGTVTS